MNNPKSDRSMSMGSASIFALLIVLPVVILLAIFHSAIWGIEILFDGLRRFFEWGSFIPAMLIGVPVHEGIHGSTWLLLGRIPKKNIKFGIKSLTPYTHCDVPLPARVYRAGAIMPAVILGMLPYIMGLGTGNGWFTAFGLIYIFAGGGDVLILWILRGVSADGMVEDHPSRVGCFVYE